MVVVVFLGGFAVCGGRRYLLLYLGLFVALDLDAFEVVTDGCFFVVVGDLSVYVIVLIFPILYPVQLFQKNLTPIVKIFNKGQ